MIEKITIYTPFIRLDSFLKLAGLVSTGGQAKILIAEGEVKECIQITPRELSMFQDKGWNARKNSFVLQGYYQFRHLLFGCLADGTYFLGVPGFFHPRERQRAMLFGCPVFKESRERHWKGRFGYWCRPLE